jgi:hypothetical protein
MFRRVDTVRVRFFRRRSHPIDRFVASTELKPICSVSGRRRFVSNQLDEICAMPNELDPGRIDMA